MGAALIAAVLNKKIASRAEIGVHEPDPARRKALKKKFRIVSFDSNAALVQASRTVLLAVKPQQMPEVLKEIRPSVDKNHLILSIAAGLDTDFFQKRLPAGTRFIRIMPNLCAMIGEGAAALYAIPEVNRGDRAFALKIFSAAGRAVFVDSEDQLDTVTAVSGSVPAFVYLFIDAMIEAGEKQGLPRELGRMLVLQTLIGAAKMIDRSPEPIPMMIERVASKGGTTEAGLSILTERGFKELIEETIRAATQRAKELRQIG